MTATALTEASPMTTTATRDIRPIGLPTVLGVELRKMFDTRSGFWLLTSIGILAALATAAVVLWAPDEELTYATFAAAIGYPSAVLLPVVAILAVTSEWSQRTGLTTFTLVPHRGRVLWAKALVTVAIGVASMVVALSIGALGNIVGSALAGVDTVWNSGVDDMLYVIGANILGMLVGFMLGSVLRNSAAAIVGYFVYWFLIPTLSMILAASQQWFADVQQWVDFSYKQSEMFEGGFTGQDWAQLAVTGTIWLVIPMVVGVWTMLRSEVK